MFTIRFVRPNKNYRMLSVAAYEVTRMDGGEAEVTMSTKLNCQDSIQEYVGPEDDYDIAYITNQAGKTIDVIRTKNEQAN